MALAGLMHARQDRIDNAQPGSATDAPARNPITGTYPAVGGTRCFERAHDGRTDGNDASAFRLCLIDCRRSSHGNAIGLIKGQPQVQSRVSRRRDSGRVRECGKPDAAPPPFGL